MWYPCGTWLVVLFSYYADSSLSGCVNEHMIIFLLALKEVPIWKPAQDLRKPRKMKEGLVF